MKKYNYDYSKLRGRIREKLNTEGRYADEIGRSISYVSQVFNNIKQFSQDDILNSMDVLSIDPCDIGVYFFKTKVHKNETEGAA